jgi:hypothetical protein
MARVSSPKRQPQRNRQANPPALELAQNPNTASGRRAIMDEFGRLSEQVAPLKKRYKQLRAQILSWYDESDPGLTLEPEGDAFMLTIGPRALCRSVADMRALHDRVGLDVFLSIVSIPMEKLDSVILPEEQAGIVVSNRTGPRQIKAVAKYSAAEATA